MRPTRKELISFGLANIPVMFYTATPPKEAKFKTYAEPVAQL